MDCQHWSLTGAGTSDVLINLQTCRSDESFARCSLAPNDQYETYRPHLGAGRVLHLSSDPSTHNILNHQNCSLKHSSQSIVCFMTSHITSSPRLLPCCSRLSVIENCLSVSRQCLSVFRHPCNHRLTDPSGAVPAAPLSNPPAPVTYNSLPTKQSAAPTCTSQLSTPPRFPNNITNTSNHTRCHRSYHPSQS